MIEKVLFTLEETEKLKSLAKGFELAPVYSQDQEKLKLSHRNSLKYDFNDSSEFKNIVFPKLHELGIKGIRSHAMIQKYTEGHYFKKHRDRTDKVYTNRLKTLVIQLSDESEYSGADLKVKTHTCSKVLGNVILFDASLIHEVTELISGVRYCFTAFLEKSDLNIKTSLL